MTVGIGVNRFSRRIGLSAANARALPIVVAGLGLVLAGCIPQAGGSTLHLQLSKDFDDTAGDNPMWHKGTISAEGLVDTSKLASMDLNADYYSDLVGPGKWTASTQQQMASWIGDCNGVRCDPCATEYGGTWDLESVIFRLEEHTNDRYVFNLWLGSTEPPRSGGCDPQINSPAIWANNVALTLTGIGTSAPSGTADGYTVSIAP